MGVDLHRRLTDDLLERRHQRSDAVGRQKPARILEHDVIDADRHHLACSFLQEFVGMHRAYAEHHHADRISP